MKQLFLSEIYVYPVKSFTGFKVDSWDVNAKGLRYDRKWMVIDKKNKFVTQRQMPRMALVKTALDQDSLILSAPSMENISVPLNQNPGENIDISIWKDQCHACPVSKQADQWISEFLGKEYRLVFQADETIRPVDPDYANPTDRVAFSDGFPFLIVSEGSLEELNHEMGLDLPMHRFRPNLVISGCEGYAEDFWRSISIGTIQFKLPKPCSRCSVPSIDIETGKTDKEPTRTLNRLRKWNKNVYFGQNALHANEGVLSVGDPVTVHQSGERQPPI